MKYTITLTIEDEALGDREDNEKLLTDAAENLVDQVSGKGRVDVFVHREESEIHHDWAD